MENFIGITAILAILFAVIAGFVTLVNTMAGSICIGIAVILGAMAMIAAIICMVWG